MFFRASQTASLRPGYFLQALAIALLFFAPTIAWAAAEESRHTFGPIFLALALLVLAAKLGGLIAQRWGQPAVLAELRLAVGIGMLPRGEVGLIFAGIGTRLTLQGKPILSEEIFSAVVMMVLTTTLVAPIGLRRTLAKAAV